MDAGAVLPASGLTSAAISLSGKGVELHFERAASP
jgi:hypothetical protein